MEELRLTEFASRLLNRFLKKTQTLFTMDGAKKAILIQTPVFSGEVKEASLEP